MSNGGGGTDVSTISKVFLNLLFSPASFSCTVTALVSGFRGELEESRDVEMAAPNCRCSDGSRLNNSSASENNAPENSLLAETVAPLLLLLLLLLEEAMGPMDTLNVVGFDVPSMTGPMSELAASASSSMAYSANCRSTYSHLDMGVTVTSSAMDADEDVDEAEGELLLLLLVA